MANEFAKKICSLGEGFRQQKKFVGVPMPVFLKVKNYETFQHYTDRVPPWIKLYNSLIDDYEFGKLSDVSKGHLVMIWLLASRNKNKLPWDAKWIGARIQAQSEVNLEELALAGFIETCSADHAEGKKEDWPSRYVPDAMRLAVLQRDGRKCVQCKAKDNLEIDHIIPVSRDGESKIENLQVLCRSCNRRKRVKISSAEQNATQEKNLRSLEENRIEEKRIEKNINTCATSSHEFVQTDQLEGQAVEAQTPAPDVNCPQPKELEPERVAGRLKKKSDLSQSQALQFSQFWLAYPKRKNKGDAEKAWSQLRPDEHLFAKILQGIERAKKSDDWRKECGQFIPLPGSWIRGKRWEDEDQVRLEPVRSSILPPEPPRPTAYTHNGTPLAKEEDRMTDEQRAEFLKSIKTITGNLSQNFSLDAG